MKCIFLLDYKKIPDNLILPIEEVEKGENIFKKKISAKTYIRVGNFYKQFKVNESLNIFLKTVFMFNFNANYQIIRNGIEIHRDITRNECYNYIINSGGKNVITKFLNKKKEILDSMCIPQKVWHKLNVSEMHGVDNIETIRYGITVTKVKK